MIESCSLCSSVARTEKQNVGYREEGITSHTKGQWRLCHEIRVSEVSVANT